jgi:NitT/TauT family transport system substrate-binding protein
MNRSTWIGSATAAALTVTTRRTAFAKAGPVVRVGGAFGDPYAEGHYAVDFGFFRKAGLNVDFQSLTTGSAVSQAIGFGSIDVGITTPIQIANAFEHGLPFVIIAPGSENRPNEQSAQIIVRKSSPLHTAKDFEGKTVGVNARRTLAELGLFAWMDKNGGDSSKVRTIEMLPTEMGPSVERGTVDAASVTEPALTGALKYNGARVLAEPLSAIGPELLISAWFTTQDYAKQNPAVCKRFLACMLDVAKWANVHRRETSEILVKYSKYEPDLARTMQRVAYAERLRLPEIQTVLDVALKYHVVGRPIAASELVFRS